MSFDATVKETGNPDFPFQYIETTDSPIVCVPAGSYFNIFGPIFSRFDIYGNGPDWDGLIAQAIELYDIEFDSEVFFNSEGGACFIEFQSNEDAKILVESLKTVFNNEKSLIAFLEQVDVGLLDG